MFKRIRWMGVGFGAGVGATVWANVKLRRTAQRFTPAALGEEVAGRVQTLRDDVLDALVSGRQAMVRREAELRAGQDPGRAPAGRQTRAGQVGPAVSWVDHGHERASARLS